MFRKQHFLIRTVLKRPSLSDAFKNLSSQAGTSSKGFLRVKDFLIFFFFSFTIQVNFINTCANTFGSKEKRR